jgi:hypothetical protein
MSTGNVYILQILLYRGLNLAYMVLGIHLEPYIIIDNDNMNIIKLYIKYNRRLLSSMINNY